MSRPWDKTSNCAIPMTPAGAIQYAMLVRDEAERLIRDLQIVQADLARDLQRVQADLKRELAALKTPSDTNWSA